MNLFDFDVSRCLDTLRAGGIILYPTDTVWGIGCDATNESAVKKIYALKKRAEQKSMIILLADEQNIHQYAKAPSAEIKKIISESERPTTIIYPNAKHLAKNLVAEDHTIAIRIVKDAFCEVLINSFGKPVVSTSANISGNPAPQSFGSIETEIKNGVDHVVLYRREEESRSTPSRILKWTGDDGPVVIRD